MTTKKIDNLSPLAQRTITLINSIPKGKVLTYSEVARLIGASGCARHVSYILSSSSSKHDLPWHRVINSQGKISLPLDSGYFTQEKKLLNEEIIVKNGRIRLEHFLWKPSSKEVKKILSGLPLHIPLKAR